METNSHEEQYAIMDVSGMVIEKSKNFDSGISGYVTDIIQKSRSVLNSKESINSIEIFFENNILMIKDDSSTNLNICSIVSEEKK